MNESSIGSQVKKLFDSIESFERNFITIFTLGVGAIILYEIVVRNLGMQGLKWIDELGRVMLITTTLVGSSMAVKHKDHMIMDVLYSVLDVRRGAILRSFTYVLSGIFYLYLAYYSIEWTMRLMRLGRTMQTINLPAYIAWVAVSFAIATTGLRYLVAAVKEFLDPQGPGELKE